MPKTPNSKTIEVERSKKEKKNNKKRRKKTKFPNKREEEEEKKNYERNFCNLYAPLFLF